MLYLSMRSEVETTGLLEGLLNSGKQVCAPVVDTEQLNLIPRQIRNPRTELARHRYGMLEPNATCPIFPIEHLQLIVIPGIAFDRKGYRLGYGKGFYDRFLVKCPHAVAVGLAYQIQLVEDTFPQQWDVPVQHIFTETGRIEM
jgi:5-formyltetrahydrofolate cyclo-ligase